MPRPRIKICCMQSHEEVAMGVHAGADAVGFVGLGLSGPEVRDDDTIARLVRQVPPAVDAWLLTRVDKPDALVAQILRTGVTTVQLCDAVPTACWEAIRAQTSARIVQVVHVQGPAAIDEALAAAPHVDALLLDSGTTVGPTPVYGGTGATHDWSISAEIVRHSTRPAWLAGGLRADNVRQAIATVQPFGLDLCSGVRTNHLLQADKLAAFMHAATP
ncbi:MAG: phosphoribosylanthranilate isomerase [Myxococcota bacterium]